MPLETPPAVTEDLGPELSTPEVIECLLHEDPAIPKDQAVAISNLIYDIYEAVVSGGELMIKTRNPLDEFSE